MEIIYRPSYETMSQEAARMFARQVLRKPNSVLGLATGSTPIGMYNHMVRMYKEGLISFSNARTFNLDEYVGLSRNNPQSYAYFMYEHLISKVDFFTDACDIPNGIAPDLEQECDRYNRKMEKCGGVDLQVLGIGWNGHIGFNEPSHDMKVKTHIVDLTEDTIEKNARFFDDINEVPRKAISMGIGSIMRARKIVLLVSGEGKREILNQTLFGPVTPEIPASILQFHNDTTVITDIKL
ncbi:MAG: glucosamine-6-phosphate deaminase [Bacillota bacterium]